MPTKASWHFKVPESIARLLKKQYLAELHDLCQNNVQIPQVTSLPIKVYGHPLLLGSTLDYHLKLMNSRKLAVTRASKVVSVLWVKGSVYRTAAIHICMPVRMPISKLYYEKDCSLS